MVNLHSRYIYIINIVQNTFTKTLLSAWRAFKALQSGHLWNFCVMLCSSREEPAWSTWTPDWSLQSKDCYVVWWVWSLSVVLQSANGNTWSTPSPESLSYEWYISVCSTSSRHSATNLPPSIYHERPLLPKTFLLHVGRIHISSEEWKFIWKSRMGRAAQMLV